jgi:hypothetical protein
MKKRKAPGRPVTHFCDGGIEKEKTWQTSEETSIDRYGKTT